MNEIKTNRLVLKKPTKKINKKSIVSQIGDWEVAKWLSDVPLIYYPWGLECVAIRFKNSLQENSKTHVIIEDIVESCHNGVVAWEKKSTIKPIMIRGNDDHFRTAEKYKILSEYFDYLALFFRFLVLKCQLQQEKL